MSANDPKRTSGANGPQPATPSVVCRKCSRFLIRMISYGPSTPELFRRAAEYVDKILRGAEPSELPVEQPTKFDLVINLKTVKALLTVPLRLLSRADEVIE